MSCEIKCDSFWQTKRDVCIHDPCYCQVVTSVTTSPTSSNSSSQGGTHYPRWASNETLQGCVNWCCSIDEQTAIIAGVVGALILVAICCIGFCVCRWIYTRNRKQIRLRRLASEQQQQQNQQMQSVGGVPIPPPPGGTPTLRPGAFPTPTFSYTTAAEGIPLQFCTSGPSNRTPSPTTVSITAVQPTFSDPQTPLEHQRQQPTPPQPQQAQTPPRSTNVVTMNGAVGASPREWSGAFPTDRCVVDSHGHSLVEIADCYPTAAPMVCGHRTTSGHFGLRRASCALSHQSNPAATPVDYGSDGPSATTHFSPNVHQPPQQHHQLFAICPALSSARSQQHFAKQSQSSFSGGDLDADQLFGASVSRTTPCAWLKSGLFRTPTSAAPPPLMANSTSTALQRSPPHLNRSRVMTAEECEWGGGDHNNEDHHRLRLSPGGQSHSEMHHHHDGEEHDEDQPSEEYASYSHEPDGPKDFDAV